MYCFFCARKNLDSQAQLLEKTRYPAVKNLWIINTFNIHKDDHWNLPRVFLAFWSLVGNTIEFLRCFGFAGVTKVRIANRGTCRTAGTCGTHIFFPKNRRCDFLNHLTMKNCDKIFFTSTEKVFHLKSTTIRRWSHVIIKSKIIVKVKCVMLIKIVYEVGDWLMSYSVWVTVGRIYSSVCLYSPLYCCQINLLKQMSHNNVIMIVPLVSLFGLFRPSLISVLSLLLYRLKRKATVLHLYLLTSACRLLLNRQAIREKFFMNYMPFSLMKTSSTISLLRGGSRKFREKGPSPPPSPSNENFISLYFLCNWTIVWISITHYS